MKTIVDINIKITEDTGENVYTKKELDAIKGLYWLVFDAFVKKTFNEFECDVDVTVRLEDDNTKLMSEDITAVKACASEPDHEWVLVSTGTDGSHYQCRKCGKRITQNVNFNECYDF